MGRVKLTEFVQAGLINDVDVVFETCVFDMFDYQGKSAEVTALRVDMKIVNDDSDEVVSQYWSVGGSKDGVHSFEPSSDGQFLDDTGGRTSLANSSNYKVLIDSLEREGLDKKRMESEGVGILDGTVCHVIRKKGEKRSYAGSDEEQQSDILQVADNGVKQWGYEDKKKKATKAASKKSDEADDSGEEGSDDDTAVMALDAVTEMLTASDGPMAITSLKLKVFQSLSGSDNAVRRAVQKLAADPEWLAEAGFTVEGKKVSA